MNSLLISYDDLDTSGLRGTLQADYLISLEAALRVLERETLVYEEPHFPVAELARALRRWLADTDRGDFEFESMSFEEVGSFAIRRTMSGWVVTSVFTPSRSSSPVEWVVVRRSVASFIRKVEGDLVALCVDPGEVLGS